MAILCCYKVVLFLLQDFHCHLTTSEVVGYLGGKWDYTTQRKSSLLSSVNIYKHPVIWAQLFKALLA